MEHEIDMGGLYHKATYKLTNYSYKYIVPNATLKLNTYVPHVGNPFERYVTNDNDYFWITIGYKAGQVFTPQRDHVLEKVKLKLFRPVVTNVGNIPFWIQNVSTDGLPTSTILSSGNIIASALTVASGGEWYEYTMSPSINVVASTPYAICTSSTNSSTVQLYWRRDLSSTASYANGYAIRDAPYVSVGWDTMEADFMFEILGHL
jgi:hypothetical protein